MQNIEKRGLSRAGVVLISLALLSGILVFAQEEEELKPRKMKPQMIQATAQGTSTQLGRMVNINILIEEYSTAADQKALIQAFTEKGNEGLNHALSKMKSKGRIAITGTLGYDLNYIREFPMPEGGRKIRFVTDRPINFGEAWSSSRSMDYSLSGGEIILVAGKDKSSGTLLPACQFKLDKENHLEIEAFQNPWKLLNIMVRK